ncbi:MAG: hypothetical protein JWO69_1547 [Thermoleophilia bacterium]|nr:hypothetical protein [Thermoleophilia bacterium]
MPALTLLSHAAFFIGDPPKPQYGTLLDRGPLLALIGGIAAGLIAWMVASACADPRRGRCLVRWLSESVSATLQTLTEFAPPVARVALGVTLVWCAALGAVVTPNLLVEGTSGAALRVAALLMGAHLVFGHRVRFAAIASVGLLIGAAVSVGTPLVVFERLDIAGLAVFVGIMGGRRLEPRMDAATLAKIDQAACWLRVLVATGLIVVAITEKLANVPMTAAVLAQHPNVDLGRLIGTDPHVTVLLLGAVEVAIAVLVLLLPLPELLALAIGAPFVLAVGEFGLLEVPGHLPVWGAVGVLALLGAHPQTSDLLTIRPPWLRGRLRTPEAARTQVVGGRVPWTVTAPVAAPVMAQVAAPVMAPVATARRIVVSGTHTQSTGTARPPITIDAPIPPFAPQAAAWLAAPAPVAAAAPVEGDRFQWGAQPARVPSKLGS